MAELTLRPIPGQKAEGVRRVHIEGGRRKIDAQRC
jgi:hypothetical protein